MTAGVKDELSRLPITKTCCRKSEVSTLLRFAGGLHIVAGRPLPASRAGVLDHMAFSGTGLPATAALLREQGVEYVLRRLPGSGLWQMFFHDPSGARVEIDFDASEPPPPA